MKKLSKKQWAVLFFIGFMAFWIAPSTGDSKTDFMIEQPKFDYNNRIEFMHDVKSCVDFINRMISPEDKIPMEIVLGMASLESGWGTSRFAIEGNNLFGIRTWDSDVPQLKPLGDPNAKFGVKMYHTKCDSVKDMMDILNNHYRYEDFRVQRQIQFEQGYSNWQDLLPLLSSWSTNNEYQNIVANTIQKRVIPAMATW